MSDTYDTRDVVEAVHDTVAHVMKQLLETVVLAQVNLQFSWEEKATTTPPWLIELIKNSQLDVLEAVKSGVQEFLNSLEEMDLFEVALRIERGEEPNEEE